MKCSCIPTKLVMWTWMILFSHWGKRWGAFKSNLSAVIFWLLTAEVKMRENSKSEDSIWWKSHLSAHSSAEWIMWSFAWHRPWCLCTTDSKELEPWSEHSEKRLMPWFESPILPLTCQVKEQKRLCSVLLYLTQSLT